MPNGAHNHHGPLSTPRARNAEPQPAPAQASEPASAQRDLRSWWKNFSKRNVKKEEEKEPEPRGIFGVPLITSIPYANVAISLFNETGESYIYGYVPIVVAKCGVFLKEKATDVEGIFRLAGSEKRIKELKIAFDTPPRWGKGLDWSGYTVHDAANILRRYFNQLPEPIIPLQHYDAFREPLRGHQAEAVGQIEGQAPSVGGFDPDAAVRVYQRLIKELPSLNRQLLLYILDLLAVFAAKSDVNKMTTSNLAAIFQPGILSHPQHDMSPQDYRLSQDVLIFLIDNQDHFLIGMEGTAVDEGTVKHIESGPSTPQARTPTTPGRNKSGLGRSASTSSSAGAESIRKFGGVRRNVSTSSRRSRNSGAIPSPTTPSHATSGSGVHRSNTVPSKRSPALTGSRFPRERGSDPPTPAADESTTQLPAVTPEKARSKAPEAEILSRKHETAVQEPTQPPQRAQTFPASMLDVGEAAAQAKPDSVKGTHNTPTSMLDVRQPVAEAKTEPAKPIQKFPASLLDVGEPTAHAKPESTKSTQNFPPSMLDIGQPTAHTRAEHTQPAVATPAMEIPGAFPLPSPGLVTPSNETHTPMAPVQAAQVLTPPNAHHPQRSPYVTPNKEKSEFMEAPVDSGLSVEPTPAVRTFTQILSKVSPSSDEKHLGRKPNKLQKKRMPSANPSAHSSTHSLTGAQPGYDNPPSPLPHPSLPQAYPTGSKEAMQSYNSDTISSRNSGHTLKPSMSPSASFRSHSTATEYSEAEQTEELPKEEKRSFWRSHKRGESKATPTASQTDLHGSVPGGDKSMSSFGSSSGWGGGRRSLQYDSHQSSDLSVPYGGPDGKEHSEKKKPFEWLSRMRADHKDRADKKARAKSPPGSTADLTSSHGLSRPKDDLAVRGRSMDIPRQTSNDSSDVTPTGTSPNPLGSSPSKPPQPATSRSPPNPNTAGDPPPHPAA